MSADMASGPAALRFAGYAAVFGKRDSGGDVILPGAFAETLSARKEAGVRLPLLWQHRPGQRIGWVDLAEEDRHGLRVIASLTRLTLCGNRDIGDEGRRALRAACPPQCTLVC